MNVEDQDLVTAYRLFFNSDRGQAVARDLMKFCCFRKPVDNQIDEGKRQVFLRILTLSQLPDEALFSFFAGRPIPMEQNDD